MKKQINPTIKAYLVRSGFYLLLLLAVCAIPFALAQRNTTKRNVTNSGAKTDASANKYMAQRIDGAVSQQPLPNISAIDASHLPALVDSGIALGHKPRASLDTFQGLVN